MKRLHALLIAAAIAGSAAHAGETVTRTGPHGTSTVERHASDGTFTASETWAGNAGGTYTRETTCSNLTCTTNWTSTGPKGKTSTGTRKTVFGNGESVTTATSTGRFGGTRSRTVSRRR